MRCPPPPPQGMEIMLDIQPISIHLRIQSITTYRRLLANGNWLIDDGEILNEKSHVIIMKRITKPLETLNFPKDKLIHTAYVSTNFKTEILPRDEINAIKKIPRPSEQNTVHCFTDGSKFVDKTGLSKTGFGYLIWGEGS